MGGRKREANEEEETEESKNKGALHTVGGPWFYLSRGGSIRHVHSLSHAVRLS